MQFLQLGPIVISMKTSARESKLAALKIWTKHYIILKNLKIRYAC